MLPHFSVRNYILTSEYHNGYLNKCVHGTCNGKVAMVQNRVNGQTKILFLKITHPASEVELGKLPEAITLFK